MQELELLDFNIVHNLVFVPGNADLADQLCAADRENARVLCYTLEGELISMHSGTKYQPSIMALSYNRKFDLLLAVTGGDPLAALPAPRQSGSAPEPYSDPKGLFLKPHRTAKLEVPGAEVLIARYEADESVYGTFS
ncbi:hypothetical protein Ciccas_006630, partial [Cichlidogyrus casuarinus]